jgi:3-dehydroquinate dehydratase/shikimate dehydrogenase
MLVAVVKAFKEIEGVTHLVDGIELRLDYFEGIDLGGVREVVRRFPVILTVRKQSQGGRFVGTEEERLRLLEKLFALRPEYIDLEWDTDRGFAQRMKNLYPDVKIISSFHDFEGTPEDLEGILLQMRGGMFDLYKIAAMANSSLDGMRMLQFVRGKTDVIAVSMGEKGTFARVLGKKYGSAITYASVGEAVAPGQLSAKELIETYHLRELDAETQVYGLIGEVVEKSPGHLFHNEFMRKRGWNGVYVKLQLQKEELEMFFALARDLEWSGLSVTMPLKEAVIPFLDELDEQAREIGAVNTLVWKEGFICGFNTDAPGALDAIGAVAGKKLVILGRGGTAKAVAYEAKLRGAEVVMVGREGALEVYDVLINCTPHPLPIDPDKIMPGKRVMDVAIVPEEKGLLWHAKEKGCEVVYGMEMWINQAVYQEEIWMLLAEHLN